jgi:hypothetical protein
MASMTTEQLREKQQQQEKPSMSRTMTVCVDTSTSSGDFAVRGVGKKDRLLDVPTTSGGTRPVPHASQSDASPMMVCFGVEGFDRARQTPPHGKQG